MSGVTERKPAGLLPGFRGGAGEPMLLVHGTGGSWRAWQPVLPALLREHELDVPDLPGCGAAAPLSGSHTPRTLTDAVEAHLDARGWQRPHVVGNSLGGLVALELARRGRTASVTAVSPAGMQRGWEYRWLRGVLSTQYRASQWLRPLIPLVARHAVTRTLLLAANMARPWQADAAWTADLIETFRASTTVLDVLDHAHDEDTTSHLHEIATPVTIVWGTRDRLLLPRQAARFMADLPAGRLERLDGLGHLPVSDDPNLVADVILRTTGAR